MTLGQRAFLSMQISQALFMSDSEFVEVYACDKSETIKRMFDVLTSQGQLLVYAGDNRIAEVSPDEEDKELLAIYEQVTD